MSRNSEKNRLIFLLVVMTAILVCGVMYEYMSAQQSHTGDSPRYDYEYKLEFVTDGGRSDATEVDYYTRYTMTFDAEYYGVLELKWKGHVIETRTYVPGNNVLSFATTCLDHNMWGYTLLNGMEVVFTDDSDS